MPLYHPFHFEAKIGPFCEKNKRGYKGLCLEIFGIGSYNDGEVITLWKK